MPSDKDKALQVYSDAGVAHVMAIASSRIEGVEPGQRSIDQVNQVIAGELKGDQLRAQWISEIAAQR